MVLLRGLALNFGGKHLECQPGTLKQIRTWFITSVTFLHKLWYPYRDSGIQPPLQWTCVYSDRFLYCIVSKDELVVPTKRKCSHLSLTTLILMPCVAGMAYIRGHCLFSLSGLIFHQIFTPSLSVGKQDGFHWHAYPQLSSSDTLASLNLFNIWWLGSENHILDCDFGFLCQL